MDVLLSDGFLVPTVEQLESLDIDLSENADPSSPCIPRLFLRFWAPLLKSLGPAFAQVLLEKLFLELQLCGDTSDQRARYVSGWISEILCGSDRAGKPAEGVRRCQARNKAHRFVSRASLQWQKLLTLCLESPCPATPRLLQQILTGMDRPLPLDTQRKLLQLCSIYTQAGGSCPSPGPEDQPVYTLESLQTHARQQAQRLAPRDCGPAEETAPKAMDALQQYPSPEAVAERAALLKGSPWQICTGKDIGFLRPPLRITAPSSSQSRRQTPRSLSTSRCITVPSTASFLFSNTVMPTPRPITARGGF
ncbi:LAS1L protein, partial [Amia calva]|nr:LAS1L protein [Amia calva]